MRSSTSRRHDIDWLRVGAVYLLFVFHAAMVFNPAPFYHIRNRSPSGMADMMAVPSGRRQPRSSRRISTVRAGSGRRV